MFLLFRLSEVSFSHTSSSICSSAVLLFSSHSMITLLLASSTLSTLSSPLLPLHSSVLSPLHSLLLSPNRSSLLSPLSSLLVSPIPQCVWTIRFSMFKLSFDRTSLSCLRAISCRNLCFESSTSRCRFLCRGVRSIVLNSGPNWKIGIYTNHTNHNYHNLRRRNQIGICFYKPLLCQICVFNYILGNITGNWTNELTRLLNVGDIAHTNSDQHRWLQHKPLVIVTWYLSMNCWSIK